MDVFRLTNKKSIKFLQKLFNINKFIRQFWTYSLEYYFYNTLDLDNIQSLDRK